MQKTDVNQIKKRMIKQRVAMSGLLLSSLIGMMSLSACAPLLFGGAVAGSALMATDRRTSGAQVEDEGIELRSANRVYEALKDKARVEVVSYNRQALVVGEAINADARAQVESILKQTENVKRVVNEVSVMPITSLRQRTNDTVITGKVKAALFDAKDISHTNFKVLTNRNEVFLMGIVSEREANRAVEIARNVDGVSRVVKVFEVVSEATLANMAKSPNPSLKK